MDNQPQQKLLISLFYNFRMDNKMPVEMDSLKVSSNPKIMKKLDPDQIILLSGTVIKINHVNKRQERALLITNKHVINVASPNSFLPNRIKRKIPLDKITGITASRYGNEVVIHVDGEDDYRFISINLKIKYIETTIIAIGNSSNRSVNFYLCDDLALGQYTTTIVDLSKHKRKHHKAYPIIVDEKWLKHNILIKPESKIIFKGETNQNYSNFEQFDIVKVLGRGAFGKVMLCKHQKTGKYYAVKSMRKEDVVEKESIERAKTQRFLLQKVNHPFLVNIEFAFQTREKIFLIMKYYRGGEMFSRIKKQKHFTEDRAKFYAAQVFLALQYLHQMGYAYRDLKPENILFDTNGYIKVSDYGLAKALKKGQKTFSLTGTASYLSPQIIMNEGHDLTVDWWAFGIFVYEMLFGVPPFYSRYQSEMFQKIVNKELEFPKDIPVSVECRHILRGLLSKYPQKRLGHGGANQIKKHQWFKDMDWQGLYEMKITPEYIPEVASNEDVSNFLQVFTKEKPIDTIINIDNKVLWKFDNQFQDFNYERYESFQEGEQKLTYNPEFSPAQFHPKTDISQTAPNFSKKK